MKASLCIWKVFSYQTVILSLNPSLLLWYVRGLSYLCAMLYKII